MNPQKITNRLALVVLTLLTLAAAAARAQVPTMLSYQGRVQVNNTNFTGAGQFKFALALGTGPTLLWKNDGSPGNTEPAAAVSLTVANGLVMTALGDTALANMTAVPPGAFTNSDVRLRVWFNGGAGFQMLAPDQRIVSVGYALMAANVGDGAITSAKLASGAVTSGKIASAAISSANLAANTVNSTHLADDLDLGATNISGRLDVYRTAANTPAITLAGSTSQISTYGSDGLEQIRLWGATYGELLLNNSLANNATTVRLSAQSSTGGALELRNTNGANRALLEALNAGGILTLYDTDGTATLIAEGAEGTGGSQINMRQANGVTTIQLDAEVGSGGGGFFALYNAAGTETITLEADEVIGDGAQLALRNAAGVATIVLDANQSNEGRITTQVLTITGGSDLSENFDVNAGRDELQPGLIVSIDPRNPGELALAREAYDAKVAGIISGAGGVKTGMLMSQAGTKADGKHPVALTGRVYCHVDASFGAIQPGDLITTSTTPGHGMKAADRARAPGSIIGKAMTGLAEGQGLVLVLVSLQ